MRPGEDQARKGGPTFVGAARCCGEPRLEGSVRLHYSPLPLAGSPPRRALEAMRTLRWTLLRHDVLIRMIETQRPDRPERQTWRRGGSAPDSAADVRRTWSAAGASECVIVSSTNTRRGSVIALGPFGGRPPYFEIFVIFFLLELKNFLRCARRLKNLALLIWLCPCINITA
jgi:hypothetical protein